MTAQTTPTPGHPSGDPACRCWADRLDVVDFECAAALRRTGVGLRPPLQEPAMTTAPTDDAAIREAERQMLMARPWHAAEHSSIWEITGDYPNYRGTFTSCLAQVLPHYVTGTDKPLFKLLGPLGEDQAVPAEWITHAVPLLLVHRSEPGTAYWADDQVWLEQR